MNKTKRIKKTIKHAEEFLSGLDIYTANAMENQLIQDLVNTLKNDALHDVVRIDWLADPDNDLGNVELHSRCVDENIHCMRAAIDAAMGMSQPGDDVPEDSRVILDHDNRVVLRDGKIYDINVAEDESLE